MRFESETQTLGSKGHNQVAVDAVAKEREKREEALANLEDVHERHRVAASAANEAKAERLHAAEVTPTHSPTACN